MGAGVEAVGAGVEAVGAGVEAVGASVAAVGAGVEAVGAGVTFIEGTEVIPRLGASLGIETGMALGSISPGSAQTLIPFKPHCV